MMKDGAACEGGATASVAARRSVGSPPSQKRAFNDASLGRTISIKMCLFTGHAVRAVARETAFETDLLVQWPA